MYNVQQTLQTEHSLIQLINQILDAFNEDKYPLTILVDLSKAFDTADHDILLEKLDKYGIKGRNLQWFHC